MKKFLLNWGEKLKSLKLNNSAIIQILLSFAPVSLSVRLFCFREASATKSRPFRLTKKMNNYKLKNEAVNSSAD